MANFSLTRDAPLLSRLRTVTLREFFFENFGGDLEYIRARGAYWALAVAPCAFGSSPRKPNSALFLLSSSSQRYASCKGIIPSPESSEGLGLTPSELADLSDPSNCKTLPSVPNQAAQIVQDFGAGSLLLWPLLNVGQDIDHSWSNPPRVTVFLSGAILFFLGWFIRRLTSTPGHQ